MPAPAPGATTTPARRGRGDRGAVSSVAVGVAAATFVVMIALSLAASAGWRSTLEPDARRRFERDAEGAHDVVVTQVGAIGRLLRAAADVGVRVDDPAPADPLDAAEFQRVVGEQADL